MSSTYAHYQGPSSLPSDYAIVARLGTHFESNIPEPQPTNTLQVPHPITRRESFPSEHYYRPLNPTIGVYPRVDPHSEASRHLAHQPTETTPLLNNPPVPRIEENIDCDASADNASNVTMFWEELAILTKYAFPVFGYAPSFIPPWKLTYQKWFAELIFLSILSLWCLSSLSVIFQPQRLLLLVLVLWLPVSPVLASFRASRAHLTPCFHLHGLLLSLNSLDSGPREWVSPLRPSVDGVMSQKYYWLHSHYTAVVIFVSLIVSPLDQEHISSWLHLTAYVLGMA